MRTPRNFCPECGQDSRDHKVSMRTLLSDFWNDVFTFDSRFFRSFLPLVSRPGALTEEYLRGRRVRYIPPLRLYLFISIAFFFLLSVRVGSRVVDRETTTRVSARPDSVTVAAVLSDLRALPDSARAGIAPESLDVAAGHLLARVARHDTTDTDAGTWVIMGKDVTEDRNRIIRGTLKLAPKVIFVLLPLFAGLLALVYRRSKRMLIEHLVFTLHYHAFIFLIFAVVLIFRWDWLFVVAVLAVPAYLLLAMRRVYGQGWVKTIIKHVMLNATYTFILLFVLVLTAGSTAYLVSVSERYPWILGWLAG